MKCKIEKDEDKLVTKRYEDRAAHDTGGLSGVWVFFSMVSIHCGKRPSRDWGLR